MALIVVMGGLFFTYSMGAKASLDQEQIEQIGEQIVSSAEKIYFLGKGNKITIKTNFPEGIENITIHNTTQNQSGINITYSYLNISYFNENGRVSSIFLPNDNYINIRCEYCDIGLNETYIFNETSINGGPKRIKVESKGDYVVVDFVK